MTPEPRKRRGCLTRTLIWGGVGVLAMILLSTILPRNSEESSNAAVPAVQPVATYTATAASEPTIAPTIEPTQTPATAGAAAPAPTATNPPLPIATEPPAPPVATTDTPTVAPTATNTPAPPAEPAQAQIVMDADAGNLPARSSAPALSVLPIANTNANLRSGPGTTYSTVGTVQPGSSLDITGISSDRQWLALAGGAWILASFVDNAPDRSLLTVQGPAQSPPGEAVAPAASVAEPVPPPPVATGTGPLAIVALNKGAEYAIIQNTGSAPVDLQGWVLRSERGVQDCLLGGVIEPGAKLTISAMGNVPGFNCGFDGNIWNNSEADPAVLLSPHGEEVARLY